VGDQVIAHMEKLGKDQATRWIEECDKAAAARFLPVAQAAIGPGPDGMDGVLKAACQMLAGLQMIADVCGLDVKPIWQSVMPKFAASLATQAATMADPQTAVVVAAVMGDLLAGRTAIYADLVAYDEVAHHSGPTGPDADPSAAPDFVLVPLAGAGDAAGAGDPDA
ncbi:hypothetical protein ADL27_26485, partial [Streptomyces sp. NRRL F-6602]